ncbi:unnamed protein product [Hydatigera taeniaeformis]|uniref:Neur_chan_LBD domain-containing protein n=1 Tax=Hydatigena taeniaeformis TaxID=6205 RepID=A0A0R3WRT2_HYDTA|nr:unnamed protein product [Hydatigera taeniaeformis]
MLCPDYLDLFNVGLNRNLHERLIKKKNYSPFVRPVKTHNSAVLLFMNLSLIQILDVDWKDHNFTWDPKEHGNVTSLLLPSEDIWTPDLALYNNAGGSWDLASSSSTLVVVNYDGTVTWRPPIIFKSQCEINVEYFPFDMQNCSMKIGCWTHHGLLIDLRHTSQKARSQPSFDNCRSQIDHAIDLSMFTTDVQWDLIGVSARRNIEFYPCCTEPYLDITFYIILRRKPLFFGVNVICPFFEISPPTSLVVPLIVKYLLFTMVLIIFSTIATVVVLNVRTRSPGIHRISPWIRKVFIHTFPKILLIKQYERIDTYNFQKDFSSPANGWPSSIQVFSSVNSNILAGLSPEQLEESLNKVRKTILYFRQQEEWNKTPTLYTNERVLTASTAHAMDAINVTRLSCETKLS